MLLLDLLFMDMIHKGEKTSNQTIEVERVVLITKIGDQ